METPRALRRLVLAALLGAASLAATAAEPVWDGYTCCNLRTDGRWISDINYAESGKRVIPAGTPVKITGYGRQRVYLEIDGGRQELGNDYSREMDLVGFARRYVVADDPKARLAGYPEPIQRAIRSARVSVGMTREQVLMAVGYPVTSENPNLDAGFWRFWIDSFNEFQVMFGPDERVSEIAADRITRNRVVAK